MQIDSNTYIQVFNNMVNLGIIDKDKLILLADSLKQSDEVFISKEAEDEYKACKAYYEVNKEVFEEVYHISGVTNRYGSDEEDTIGLRGYGFYYEFLRCNGLNTHNTLEVMQKLIQLKDEYMVWDNIRREIEYRCIDIDKTHKFIMLKDKGLYLYGKGWNKDMKWLVKLGQKYQNGFLFKDIKTVEDFKDLIRFKGLLGGTEGSMESLKALGDMYDILDAEDVKVLKSIIDKYDDKKRAFLGNKIKRKVVG